MDAYWYWFCHELYIDRGWARELLKEYGNPRMIFGVKEEALMAKYPQKSIRHLEILRRRSCWNLSKEYDMCRKKGIRLVTSEEADFPEQIKKTEDPPLGLFVIGELPKETVSSVAVVGARMCSDYGRMAAYTFGKEFALHGVQVISGMASGVDGYTHKGALEAGGKTFAVLGCGVDICYPKHNRELYGSIKEQGGVISEYPPGTAPMSYLFPMRNRIISGLCKSVVVVEAREKSGSLITADTALEQGRDVFAVPGRIGDALSEGCNRLISQGAGIALSPEYVLREMGIFDKNMVQANKNKKKLLESAEDMVYSCLSLQSQHIDEVQKKTGLPLLEVMRSLVSLELKGLVAETRKNYYSKTECV